MSTVLGDLRVAHPMAVEPPALRDAIERIWRWPRVYADNPLLKFLLRIYGLVAIPLAFCLYRLGAAQLHPGQALIVDGLLAYLLIKVW